MSTLQTSTNNDSNKEPSSFLPLGVLFRNGLELVEAAR
jgi:hypothetical protein